MVLKWDDRKSWWEVVIHTSKAPWQMDSESWRPSNGKSPDNNKYSSTPRLQTSAARLYVWLCSTSGALNSTDPTCSIQHHMSIRLLDDTRWLRVTSASPSVAVVRSAASSGHWYRRRRVSTTLFFLLKFDNVCDATPPPQFSVAPISCELRFV